MIGMEMRDEQRIELSHRHLDLPHADRHATPGIEQKLLIAGFDERARPETCRPRGRRRGAKQRYLEVRLRVSLSGRRKSEQDRKQVLHRARLRDEGHFRLAARPACGNCAMRMTTARCRARTRPCPPPPNASSIHGSSLPSKWGR